MKSSEIGQRAAGSVVPRPAHPGQTLFLLVVVSVVMLPVLVLAWLALTNSSAELADLAATVLPAAALVTIELLALVAILTGTIGVITAWLIVYFEFPMRRVMSWALVLPIAIPTYIAAYAFVEFFHFTGPVQSLLRDMFGYQSARDYWFPNIRSLGGASIIMSLVLYPYVYLATRVVFLMQSRHAADVARSLGAAPFRVFWRILLPMARPAVIAGVTLAMMETLNDLGAVEYLGIRTLTFSVNNTWLAQGSLAGAAQLACAVMAVVFVLLRLEQYARRAQRFHLGRISGGAAGQGGTILKGWRAFAALLICAAPVFLGFGIPLFVIGSFAIRRTEQFLDPQLHAAIINSISIGGATATLAVLISLGLGNAGRVLKSIRAFLLIRLASIGYSIPGTVLALGLLFSLAATDNWLDAIFRRLFGVSTGLMLTGSAFAIILALTIRFLALAEGTIQAGFEKIHPNIDDAARNLGQTSIGAARRVLLPLLRPAILTAFVLVFVDCLKELSATILLRPLGFNTLATYVYENASRAAVEDGAAAALLIVLAGLAPVIFLSSVLMRHNGERP